jgi:hypothetical protein
MVVWVRFGATFKRFLRERCEEQASGAKAPLIIGGVDGGDKSPAYPILTTYNEQSKTAH